MPRLSIITINYNNSSGLRKTIQSVVSQTSNNFEYIVIDGDPTDGSIDVTMFDMSGISNISPEPGKRERRRVLEELVPFS